MIRWEKEKGEVESPKYKGYLGKTWQFSIFEEDSKIVLTSVLFYDKVYSSYKNAKRGAERILKDWLSKAGLGTT